jgi:hypothetical protein
VNISDFLEARITEDEAAARPATPGPWEWEPETDGWGDCGPNLATVAKLPPYKDGSQSPVDTIIGSWGHDANGISVEPANAAHIARHDPSRVLAECAAKRAIIAEHGPKEVASLDRATWGQPFVVCRVCAVGPRQVVAPCPTVRLVAAVYKDHPDYQQEWTL